MADLYGQALLDYVNGNYTEDLYSETSISELDVFPLPYLFRTFKEMPEMEQKALEMSKGKILDIGSGSGSHSLYLQEKGMDVTAVDLSAGAAETALKRGIKKVEQGDIRTLNLDTPYDTLLLLMNGAGMAGSKANTLSFLIYLKSLMSKEGQILLDSSDILYMFEDEDGGLWLDMNKSYYGDVEFNIHYKGQVGEPFDWVYLDFESLEEIANQAGLKAEKILDGPHHDYLARLTILEPNV